MFFERPDSGEVAILVHIDIDSETEQEDPAEFEELALSAGAMPVDYINGSRRQPAPSHFVGTGKLAEIAEAVRAHKAELVLFNHTLSPSQERNLERELRCRVLDRTGLILDIFAQRARSHEGKLQVELAQLQHMRTRLKRGWTHLDRQKGGIGLRGAGETQLELDQRMLGQRIKAIHKSLDKVRGQRQQSRRARARAETATISLVGYTNAGKSTLFNRLTEAGAFAADQLFATLDSTLRRIALPNYGSAVLADTVGFISHLPHGLVQAFHATLEETANADLLLQVVDAASAEHDEHIATVAEVLGEIGAGSVPQLQVFNKIDLLSGTEPHIQRDAAGKPFRVWVSAGDNRGIELLQTAISELLSEGVVETTIIMEPRLAGVRSRLYEKGYIEDEVVDDQGCYHLRIKMPAEEYKRLQQDGLTLEALPDAPASEQADRADQSATPDARQSHTA